MLEARGPIVTSTSAMLGNENIFWVVQVLILAVTDIIDNTGLQVEQLKRALVKKVALGSKLTKARGI